MTKRKKQKLIKGVLSVVCLLILAFIWYVINPMLDVTYEVPDGAAEIHFIDVGQGDATLIMTGGKNMLIDTGEKDAEEALTAYLDEKGVSELEYFVVTHFDSDHFANAVTVLEKYDVKKLLIPDQVKNTKTYERFMEKVEEQAESGDIEVLVANDMIGTSFQLKDMEISVLAPLSSSYEDSNDNSVVLMARFGNRRVLLSGDAEKESEADMVERYTKAELDCDVFKLGHHGSRTSSSQDLLDLATPEYAIASCGEGNSYNHPHREVLERVQGLTLYRTDINGSIVFTIQNDEITVKTEKDS